MLDRDCRSPATWVAGPAGSGKTVLISSYIEHQNLPCLWYHMDEGDSDISTFFYYMGLAGKKAAPRRKKSLPHLTPEYALGIPTFTRKFFEELFDRLKENAVLVLDNYQEARHDSPIHEVMRHALSAVPDRGRIFILSRTEPPPPLARARANNRMNMIF